MHVLRSEHVLADALVLYLLLTYQLHFLAHHAPHALPHAVDVCQKFALGFGVVHLAAAGDFVLFEGHEIDLVCLDIDFE
jgi:hypothetical protein